jgi:hypothetical protein
LWNALGGEDAATAHRGVYTLAARPAEAIPFLRANLKRVEAVPPEHVRRLIAELDSDEFARREAATRELTMLGSVVESELNKALATADSLEMKNRLRGLLQALAEKWAVTNPEERRAVRGVWALQRAGTTEARSVLETLATGADGARLTREARNALSWLDRRAKLPRE